MLKNFKIEGKTHAKISFLLGIFLFVQKTKKNPYFLLHLILKCHPMLHHPKFFKTEKLRKLPWHEKIVLT